MFKIICTRCGHEVILTGGKAEKAPIGLDFFKELIGYAQLFVSLDIECKKCGNTIEYTD